MSLQPAARISWERMWTLFPGSTQEQRLSLSHECPSGGKEVTVICI